MSVMTGYTLLLCCRIMFEFIFVDLGSYVRVTVETNLTRLPGNEEGLTGAMGAMTEAAIPLGKRWMSGLFRSFADQVFVTGHAKFPFVHGLFEKTGFIAAMG